MAAPSHGIYVHTPWCRSRCAYCAFAVSTEPPRWADWVEGLRAEWALRRAAFPGPADSLYFGGGTPSLAPTAVLGAVVDLLPRAPGAEITIEVNPGDLSADRLRAWRALGIHRLSLGVQTFSPAAARLLNRRHTVAQARELVALVREAGLPTWSVDVIFALPGQTPADFEADLAAILEVAPPHVSLYGLSYEPGTPLTRARDAGRLQPPDAEAWRAMYDRAVDALAAAGLERYEVSNFARPGHRSRHNEATWRAGHYAGLGPSAHGFAPDGRRTRNHPTLDAWRADPAGVEERPDADEAAVDQVLSSLRHVDGLDLALLAGRTGRRPAPAVVRGLVRGGVLEAGGDHLRLTRAGFPVADGVVSRLCAALEPAG